MAGLGGALLIGAALALLLATGLRFSDGSLLLGGDQRWLLYNQLEADRPRPPPQELRAQPPPPPQPPHVDVQLPTQAYPWETVKRSVVSGGVGGVGGGGGGKESPQQPSSTMHRKTRGSRQYDVPQIECPPAEDGMERFACPNPDHMGRYHCIDDHVLCDGFIDCPNGEDEDRQACMFYKTTKAHLDVLADALLRWARGR